MSRLALLWDRGAWVREALAGGSGVLRLVVLTTGIALAVGGRGLWVLSRDLSSVDFSQVPEITIEAGRATSPVQQPYRLDTELGPLWLDTTGALTEAQRQDAVVVLDAQTITLRRPGQAARTHRLESLPTLHIGPDTAGAQLWRLLGIGVVALALGRALLVAAFALIGAAMVRRRAGSRFREALGLVTLALVPVAALDILQGLVGAQVPGWHVIALGLWAAYGEWAARSLAEVTAYRGPDPEERAGSWTQGL